MKPEEQVKKDIRDVLKSLGLFYWMPPHTIYGTGVSDFVVLIQGRALFIEAKALASSNWTANQQRFAAKVQANGAPYWLIHAGNVIQLPMLLRDFMEELELCFSNSSLPAKPCSTSVKADPAA